MSRTAFNRDNVLTPQDRIQSAGKCLNLLEDHMEAMTDRERSFCEDVNGNIDRGVSERQLAWLRDLVEKYAQ